MAHRPGSRENAGNDPGFHRENRENERYRPDNAAERIDERSICALARSMMLGLQHRHYDERSPAAISKDSFPEHAFFLETQNSVQVTRTVIVREDIQPQTVCTNFGRRGPRPCRGPRTRRAQVLYSYAATERQR